ncbi:hypothetical protein D9M72_645490 [compost metagenome]
MCIDALTGMGLAMQQEADATGLWGDLMEASYNHDGPAMEAATEKLKAHNATLDTAKPKLLAAITDCRAKGK